jgi:hypothetical protein
MSIFVDFLDKLPPNNSLAVGQMLNQLSEDDAGFIQDYLMNGSEIPGNIIRNINQAFMKAGFPQFTWENCQMDTRDKRYDAWFDEVN